MRILRKGIVLGLLIGLVTPSSIEPKSAIAAEYLMAPKSFASFKMKQYGWNSKEYGCLVHLWTRESNWNPLSYNKTPVYAIIHGKKVALHARGIAQKLGETSVMPHTQIAHGLDYIRARYGSPCKAWGFWQFKSRTGVGWY